MFRVGGCQPPKPVQENAPAPAMLVTLPRTDLCLGFVNTRSWRGRAEPSESLLDLEALVRWLGKAGGLPQPFAHEMEHWCYAHLTKAARTLADAIGLREALFRLFVGAGASTADFATLQHMLAAAPARQHLVSSQGSCFWRIECPRPEAADLLAPVLWSAADLLVSEARDRVRCCANAECLWLYLDGSRKGTRRWCDMASCGNRAKARRHYLKSKAA